MADAERAEALVESQLGKTIQGDPRTVELVSGTQGVWRDSSDISLLPHISLIRHEQGRQP